MEACTRTISLTHGYTATIDATDYPLVAAYEWQALEDRVGHLIYAITKRPGRTMLQMHRVILGFGPNDPHIDHRDGDGLNNRRSNLRPCTRALNGANRRKQQAPSSSRFKGVAWDRHGLKWRARIHVSGKNKSLGMFDSEIEAARAYNTAAAQYFGEFARLNDLEGN